MKKQIKWLYLLGFFAFLLMSNVAVAQSAATPQDLTHRMPAFKQVYEKVMNVQITDNVFRTKIEANDDNLQEWTQIKSSIDADNTATQEEKDAAAKMYARLNFIISRQ